MVSARGLRINGPIIGSAHLALNFGVELRAKTEPRPSQDRAKISINEDWPWLLGHYRLSIIVIPSSHPINAEDFPRGPGTYLISGYATRRD
jgi:hypothetical protein